MHPANSFSVAGVSEPTNLFCMWGTLGFLILLLWEPLWIQSSERTIDSSAPNQHAQYGQESDGILGEDTPSLGRFQGESWESLNVSYIVGTNVYRYPQDQGISQDLGVCPALKVWLRTPRDELGAGIEGEYVTPLWRVSGSLRVRTGGTLVLGQGVLIVRCGHQMFHSSMSPSSDFSDSVNSISLDVCH